ncbi:hypothetical protein B0O99DRAFT_644405 [Bisporella sp. PMI_857]|nr:hypothetical protein B0O99DRAFT_644405 [Bisporella sp. PMI_857]
MHGSRLFIVSLLASALEAQQIINGQIFTPGIVVVDAPQPDTPLGGDTLHVALDVTANGLLQLPPYPENPISAIYNVSIFLSSYTTGKNFTVSNGTASAGNASLGNIMVQEPGSTVKHINWIWPACLVGDGAPSGDSARGIYNISIRQNFRLNDTNAYTIFDLPIKVTNSIPESSNRPPCDALNNQLLSQDALSASADNFTRIPGTAIQSNGQDGNTGSGLGPQKPEGSTQDGLGAGEMLHWRSAIHWVWIASFVMMLAI